MKRGSHSILVGDCMTELAGLPAKSIHACVTSPPYFSLRSYVSADSPLKALEIGSEPDPDTFVATMVAVFREVRRVLRDDAYMFVNLGDSFGGENGKHRGSGKRCNGGAPHAEPQTSGYRGMAGQQLLMPHRVALALQQDGWVLRDTVIWSKRSPMPSSQNGVRFERCRIKVSSPERDRTCSPDGERGRWPNHSGDVTETAKWKPCPGCKKCEKNGGYVLRRGQGRTTTSHEYLFLFAKNNGYFWDMENCREPCGTNTHSKGTNKHHKNGKVGRERTNASFQDAIAGPVSHRIPRSVWTLSSEPTKFNHFATYPSELVRRCLMPLSPRGCCPTCGAQWAPVVDKEERILTGRRELRDSGRTGTSRGQRSGTPEGSNTRGYPVYDDKVVDYRPTCSCELQHPVSCRVLDPFSGTGTTGQTACFLGHDYVGIELNPDYAAHSDEWITKEPRWSLRTKKPVAKPKKVKSPPGQQQLFVTRCQP